MDLQTSYASRKAPQIMSKTDLDAALAECRDAARAGTIVPAKPDILDSEDTTEISSRLDRHSER